MWIRLVPVVMMGLMMLAGCGKSDPFNRQAVSGTATMDGKPIPYGNIEFAPAEGQPTNLSLEIKDGKFAVDAKGGLAPGKYIVRFQGFDGPMPPPGDAPGTYIGPVPKVIVPNKYNAQSTETIVVKPGEKNEFTFALKN